jgi:hypothetical protein
MILTPEGKKSIAQFAETRKEKFRSGGRARERRKTA